MSDKTTCRKNFSENEEGAFRDALFGEKPLASNERRCCLQANLFQPARE